MAFCGDLVSSSLGRSNIDRSYERWLDAWNPSGAGRKLVAAWNSLGKLRKLGIVRHIQTVSDTILTADPTPNTVTP